MLYSANMSSRESSFDFFHQQWVFSHVDTGLNKFSLPRPTFSTCNFTCAPDQTQKMGAQKPRFVSYRETTGNISFNSLLPKYDLGFFNLFRPKVFAIRLMLFQAAT